MGHWLFGDIDKDIQERENLLVDMAVEINKIEREIEEGKDVTSQETIHKLRSVILNHGG